MDEYMVGFRLVHIFAGIIWVGFAWFMTFMLRPAVQSLGKDGQTFMQGLLKNTSVAAIMPIVSLLTVASGLLLYYRISDHFNSDWMSSTAGAVLSIGSAAGIFEFIFGGVVIGPTMKKIGQMAGELENQGRPPSEDQLLKLRGLQTRMGWSERVSTIMTVVAVIGMAAARYM
jgi:hypothetical protein